MALQKLSGLFVLALVSKVAAQSSSTSTSCKDLLGGSNVTLLLVADVGTFTGTAEGSFYAKALQNNVTIDPGSTSCASWSYGTIFGQPVALIATGIGEANAAICTSEVLQCGNFIKDVIYSGTAGFSAQASTNSFNAPDNYNGLILLHPSQVGGAVDPSDCATPNTRGAPVKLGDVCITPFAVNWNCRQGSYNQACGAYPNQCGAPGYAIGPNEPTLFGQCFFDTYAQANVDLSNELIRAATATPTGNSLGVTSPTPAPYLSNYSSTYWALQSNSSRSAFSAAPTLTNPAPNVWNYTVCAETDSQWFWTSLPWDYLGRSYVSMTINEALNVSTKASSVIAVSAEEGTGFLAAMYKYAGMTGGRLIPHTQIRAASNYVYLPVAFDGVGFWSQSTALEAVDFSQSFNFAIASMSSAVLKMLQTRCVALNGAASSTCSFVAGQGVTYSSSG